MRHDDVVDLALQHLGTGAVLRLPSSGDVVISAPSRFEGDLRVPREDVIAVVADSQPLVGRLPQARPRILRLWDARYGRPARRVTLLFREPVRGPVSRSLRDPFPYSRRQARAGNAWIDGVELQCGDRDALVEHLRAENVPTAASTWEAFAQAYGEILDPATAALAHRRLELDEHRRINGCASVMLATIATALLPLVVVLVVVTDAGGTTGMVIGMALLVVATVAFLVFLSRSRRRVGDSRSWCHHDPPALP